jgi:hypothetical protein
LNELKTKKNSLFCFCLSFSFYAFSSNFSFFFNSFFLFGEFSTKACIKNREKPKKWVLKCQKEAKKDSLTEMLPSELGAGTQQTKTDLKDLLEMSFSEIML